MMDSNKGYFLGSVSGLAKKETKKEVAKKFVAAAVKSSKKSGMKLVGVRKAN